MDILWLCLLELYLLLALPFVHIQALFLVCSRLQQHLLWFGRPFELVTHILSHLNRLALYFIKHLPVWVLSRIVEGKEGVTVSVHPLLEEIAHHVDQVREVHLPQPIEYLTIQDKEVVDCAILERWGLEGIGDRYNFTDGGCTEF